MFKQNKNRNVKKKCSRNVLNNKKKKQPDMSQNKL